MRLRTGDARRHLYASRPAHGEIPRQGGLIRGLADHHLPRRLLCGCLPRHGQVSAPLARAGCRRVAHRSRVLLAHLAFCRARSGAPTEAEAVNSRHLFCLAWPPSLNHQKENRWAKVRHGPKAGKRYMAQMLTEEAREYHDRVRIDVRLGHQVPPRLTGRLDIMLLASPPDSSRLRDLT